MLTRRATVLGLAAVAGCAPTVQRPGLPPPGFQGPALRRDSFVAADGVVLPLHVWPAEAPEKGVVVALHGMNDYGGAFAYSSPWFAGQGITTYAYDQRGFGRAPRRGVWPGAALMTEDLRTLCALVRARHPSVPLLVLGHSMGGAVTIAAFASDRPPAADRVVLAAPATWGWNRQSLINQILLWSTAHVAPRWRIDTPEWLARRIQASDNIPVLRQMGADPNMIFSTRVDAIYGLMNLMQRADQQISQVKAPILFLYGAKDELIPPKAALAAAAKLKPTDRSAYYENGWHLLTRDLMAPTIWRDIEAFVLDPTAPAPSGAPPVPTAPAAAGAQLLHLNR